MSINDLAEFGRRSDIGRYLISISKSVQFKAYPGLFVTGSHILKSLRTIDISSKNSDSQLQKRKRTHRGGFFSICRDGMISRIPSL